ncbi:unnamed protein product [Protopolystoma xenopodis]|uniref:Uncharacterized protein n=1 Tax=Protopolystoma xenopodis TaxID=117903 RepID=A0A448WL76_9PLAT|nr:unnamed protein product [Protopolystoma xenopodis]
MQTYFRSLLKHFTRTLCGPLGGLFFSAFSLIDSVPDSETKLSSENVVFCLLEHSTLFNSNDKPPQNHELTSLDTTPGGQHDDIGCFERGLETDNGTKTKDVPPDCHVFREPAEIDQYSVQLTLDPLSRCV